jgi:thermitase
MILGRRHKGFISGVFAAVTLGAAGLVAGQALGADYIVKFRTVDEAKAASSQKSLEGARVTDSHEAGSLVKVDLGQKSRAAEARALAALMARPDVEYVVENFKLQMFSAPNDPKYAEQWALPKVRAPEAWDVSLGSREVTVAVIDTGTDWNHPDLKANIWTNPNEVAGNNKDDDGNGVVDDVHGYDFLDNDADPNDSVSQQNPGHGTHCAGIIGAVGNNGVGTSGMAQQVSIIPLRFIGPTGQGDLMAAIKAIDYAVAVKADVISASWGAQVAASQATPLIEAIGRADAAGITFVAAAANNGANNDSTPMFPANAEFASVIAVAASDDADGKPSWSNYGKAMVALASPGLNIMSTLPNASYGNLSGTSMATPLVAGLVALLKSEAEGSYATLGGASAEALLQATGAQVAIETACMCRVDAAAALTAVKNEKLVVVPSAATFAPNGTTKLAAIGGAGGYTFASGNPSIVEVAADGTATAKAVGETTISVTDSAGATAQSLVIRVAEGGGGGGDEECPLGDPTMCQLLCMIDPTLPWCN